MINIKRYFILLALIFISFSGCEELILDEEPADSPRSNFEYLWKECKEKYSFFEYKNIDWDAVYDEYSPQIEEDMGQVALFDVLFQMLNELRDGHVNLFSPFNLSRFDIDLLGPENFDFRVIRENYLGDDYWITGPFQHDFLADGKVGYVRYSSFSNFVSNLDLDFIFLRYRETDGLILDLRQNGGGSVSNVFRILNRFAKEKTLIYNSSIKTGPGPNDFSTPQDVYIEPLDEDRLGYDGEVIVLIDRGSFSATSFFSLGAMALPNFSLMGDTSGGGLGIPNGGQLPNGWTYRFSISRTLTPDGQNYEDGVPPDFQVIISQVDKLQGRDTVIEEAIEQLAE